jgi:hypothetical protein
LTKTINNEFGTDTEINENLICVGRKNRKKNDEKTGKRQELENKMISDEFKWRVGSTNIEDLHLFLQKKIGLQVNNGLENALIPQDFNENLSITFNSFNSSQNKLHLNARSSLLYSYCRKK